MLREKLCVTFHFLLDLEHTAELRGIGDSTVDTMIKNIRREHLLGRMKAGLERFLARRRREDPLLAERPMPSSDRVLEILGESSRRSEGPAKGA
jgi:hypothetical protein